MGAKHQARDASFRAFRQLASASMTCQFADNPLTFIFFIVDWTTPRVLPSGVFVAEHLVAAGNQGGKDKAGIGSGKVNFTGS
jgi:hypothetical protein